MDQIITQAKILAYQRHAGQVRPNRARQPKTAHMSEVAYFTRIAGGTPAMIAAAWLHDIVEDTPTTHDEIHTLFGAELVDGLTDPPHFEPLPLAERKALQAERLTNKSPPIHIIKLADQLSNIISVYKDPPLDWPSTTSRAYIEGAANIAHICQGKSTLLDQMFQDILQKARNRYSAG